jgi:hypothetical protein
MTMQSEPEQSGRAVLRLIPLDVWAATALAIAIALVDPISTIFVGACLALFAYVVFEAFGGKLS